MQLLYSFLVPIASHLWMIWDHSLVDVLETTAQYFNGENDAEGGLICRWKTMKAKAMANWVGMVNMPALIAEEDF